MTNLKFNTFIDTYTLPYVSTHRYWTGLMLLLRFVLSLIPALNYSGNLKIVLAFITFTIGLVLFLKSLLGRVYTKQGIDILETLFLLNLLFFTVFTWFALDATHIQTIISYVSVITSFILLLIVLLYHVYVYTKIFSRILNCKYLLIFTQLFRAVVRSRNQAQLQTGGHNIYSLDITDPEYKEYPTYTEVEAPKQILLDSD